mmetsp:Transcript_79203/g.164375  ORF Transcript_79203/g.164375 Transcript_79203/m.164375 type:complete len:320 (+) Transcript_79203:347-1306(+)
MADSMQGEVVLLELSPFDIHFSQERIRNEFQDGRSLNEAIEAIEAVPCSEALAERRAAPEADPEDGYFLRVPFPRIEVIKWRCKLRDAEGRPMTDASSGLQLYSSGEHWFTFDNRRLCCLQRAAVKLHPKPVVCEVLAVPQTMARTRELRKFDTRTFGNTVAIGKRDNTNIETWSWREALGLPEEIQPSAGVARQQRLRWRGGRREGPKGPHRRSGNDVDEEDEEAERGNEFTRSLSLFLAVYLLLRLVVWLVRRDYCPWLPDWLRDFLGSAASTAVASASSASGSASAAAGAADAAAADLSNLASATAAAGLGVGVGG